MGEQFDMTYLIGMVVALVAIFFVIKALSKSKTDSVSQLPSEKSMTQTNAANNATNHATNNATNVSTNTATETNTSAVSTKAVETSNTANKSDWVMPIQGSIVPLSEVPDPAFSSGAMGAGFGINPTGGQVVSPVAGTVTAIFPTKHAICIDGVNGEELLIHVGVDTVSLNGEGFAALVTDGQQVQAGTPLLEVDWATIRAKAPSAITPVLFTNMDNGEVIEIQDGKPVVVN